jgi:hypothetical protein
MLLPQNIAGRHHKKRRNSEGDGTAQISKSRYENDIENDG